MKFIINRCLGLFGQKLVKKHYDDMTYFHNYKGGYDEYRKTQIRYNKRKIQNVWADKNTLSAVKDCLLSYRADDDENLMGICHGARNGFEVDWFNSNLSGHTIGTDISDTAHDYPNMYEWDFHKTNKEWLGKFDFVYSNSFDQAMDPEKALRAWAEQLNKKGIIFIEHSRAHSSQGAGKMDPFGAHPMCMPYLLFEWSKDLLALHDILHVSSKSNNNMRAWIFALRRI